MTIPCPTEAIGHGTKGDNFVSDCCFVTTELLAKTSSRNILMLRQTFSGNIKIAILCFLEDVDRVWKLKKDSLDGSRSVPFARLFPAGDLPLFEVFQI